MGLPSTVNMRKCTLTLPLAYLSQAWNHPFECVCDLTPPSSLQDKSVTVIAGLVVCTVVIHKKIPDSHWDYFSEFCFTHLFAVHDTMKFLEALCGVSHPETSPFVTKAAGSHISLYVDVVMWCLSNNKHKHNVYVEASSYSLVVIFK